MGRGARARCRLAAARLAGRPRRRRDRTQPRPVTTTPHPHRREPPVTTTAPTETPPDETLSPQALAAELDEAATLIETNGLCRGDYWPRSLALGWADGQPLDVVGAIAVAAGITDGV